MNGEDSRAIHEAVKLLEGCTLIDKANETMYVDDEKAYLEAISILKRIMDG